jgi:phosphatidylserine/phosphatidylglycerophosphate/cardiolipin synthase-like enzyme
MKIPAFTKFPVLFVAAIAIIEMLNGGHYTQRIISGGIQQPVKLLADSTINAPSVGFSPGGRASEIVLSAIQGAKSTIDVAAFSFTSKPIVEALIEATSRGVKVRVVTDKSQAFERYSITPLLKKGGITIRVNEKYSQMHNKFMVIDSSSVQTGSFNYTTDSESYNAENVIFLKSVPKISEAYTREFERLYSESDNF